MPGPDFFYRCAKLPLTGWSDRGWLPNFHAFSKAKMSPRSQCCAQPSQASTWWGPWCFPPCQRYSEALARPEPPLVCRAQSLARTVRALREATQERGDLVSELSELNVCLNASKHCQQPPLLLDRLVGIFKHSPPNQEYRSAS